MRKVGIIGAGQMGSGIAQTVAQHGIDVLLADVELSVAEKAKAGIDRTPGKLVGKGKIGSAEAEAALARIRPVAGYGAMAGAELIIGAAAEGEEVKGAIFGAAGEMLAQDAGL